jgi:hypothetical protein
MIKIGNNERIIGLYSSDEQTFIIEELVTVTEQSHKQRISSNSLHSLLKGIVQRKLRWVEIGIKQ